LLHSREEFLIVAFRRHTLLPVDDCLYALQATVPHLTRSSLHRLFQRQGVSRLPNAEGTRVRRKFNNYPIGYIHIDLAEVWTDEGKLYLFIAIDRVSTFAFAELHERATRRTHVSLREHLATLLDAYNFAKRLKSLCGLTPVERICQLWTEQPQRFRLNPLHHIPGLNI
jgi:hypothetical protein